jgi:hypothetical protein
MSICIIQGPESEPVILIISGSQIHNHFGSWFYDDPSRIQQHKTT